MKKLLLALVSFGAFAFSANVVCPTYTQNNDLTNKIWNCPTLNGIDRKDYTIKLKDVNTFTGQYECEYINNETSDPLISCKFENPNYKKKVDEAIIQAKFEAHTNHAIDFNKIYNFLNINNIPINIQEVNKRVNEVISKIYSYVALEDKDGAVNAQSKVKQEIEEARKLSYKVLVEPYLHPIKSDITKDANFAMFMGGLITLNPTYIAGVNPATGELEVTKEWENKTKKVFPEIQREKSTLASLWEKFVNLFGFETDEQENFRKANEAIVGYGATQSEAYADFKDSDYSIVDYAEIFKTKFFGFYYNVQKMFDTGYSLLVLQLFFIFGVFKFSGVFFSGGIKFFTAKQEGGNYGEHHINEEIIKKVLIGISIFSVFFLSLPSKEQVKDPDGITFQKNLTIAKMGIRYVIDLGNKTGTMFSDLGMYAFNDFLVKKEGLYVGKELLNSQILETTRMVNYYPSYLLRQECLGFYQTDLASLVGDNVGIAKPINPNYKDSSKFFKENNVDEIAYGLCRRVARDSIIYPKTTLIESIKNESRIENVNELMAESVKNIVRNNVISQQEMGWFNILNIPFTYYILQNNEGFVEPTITEEEAGEIAEKYFSNIGLKDGRAISGVDFVDKVKHLGNYTADEATHTASALFGYISRMGFYRMLPGFASIEDGLAEYFKNVYTNYLLLDKDVREKDSPKIKGEMTKEFGKVKKLGYKMGFGLSKLWSKLISLDIFNNPFVMGVLIKVLSFFMALWIWGFGFKVIMFSTIGLIFLFMIGGYIVQVVKHFTLSLFKALWALGDNKTPYEKIKRYGLDTVLIALKPTVIVFSAFLFIFILEIFKYVFMIVMKTNIKQQEMIVSLIGNARFSLDSFSSYFTLVAFENMIEVLLGVISLIFTVVITLKMYNSVLEILGVHEGSAKSLNETTEQAMARSERHSNPLA